MYKEDLSNIVFETEWFSIDEIPNKSSGKAPYYRLSCDDSVEILAVTRAKKIILVRQFRPALGLYMFELPAGHVNKNETPRDAAGRELKEETGFVCESLSDLGSFKICPSRINNTLNVFFGEGAVETKERSEDTEVILVTQNEFEELIEKGEFVEVAGLAIYFLAKSNGHL